MRCLSLILLLTLVSVAGAKPVLNIQQWRTSNGIKVLFVRAQQNPMLDIAVVFKAGSIYDKGNYGLANLTNGMLNEGTSNADTSQLAEKFDDVGAVYNNFTNREMSIVTLRTLVKSKYLSAALNTFTDVLRNPTFPQSSLQRIEQQMVVYIKSQQQSPSYTASKLFRQAIWGNHPYANPTEGTLTSVPAITQQQVENFYKKYYVAKNAMLMMVGDVTVRKARMIANQIVGRLPQGVGASTPSEATSNKASEQHINFPSAQNTIFIGTLGIKRSDPDYIPLLVGNYILGGSGNLNSILMSNVREKYGLTYGVYSSLQALSQRGVFAIAMQSRNDQAKRASDMVQDYLADYVAKGPTKQQLKQAKQFLIGSFPMAISNNSQILSTLVDIGYYDLPLNYLDTYRKKINAVTAAQVTTALQNMVNLKNLVVISVGGKT